ncbi:uncharacterized protein LOC130588067 [Malurus melanocephalus]|uniref:uncharacterized protein LOC130588067 n=1 Tax=Malurus melanocephalus TaxID=175006 RepID=UPI0025497708|nr:uncharacterized protein LOC130588067 [Malurus melanocephalus]
MGPPPGHPRPPCAVPRVLALLLSVAGGPLAAASFFLPFCVVCAPLSLPLETKGAEESEPQARPLSVRSSLCHPPPGSLAAFGGSGGREGLLVPRRNCPTRVAVLTGIFGDIPRGLAPFGGVLGEDLGVSSSPLSRPGAAPAPPRPVSAVLGGSALLSLDLSPKAAVKAIEWTFSSGTGATILVAVVGPGGFERPDPQDRFGERLEVGETELRIRDLKWGDNGTFQGRVKLIKPALVHDQSFELSLYGGCRSYRSR